MERERRLGVEDAGTEPLREDLRPARVDEQGRVPGRKEADGRRDIRRVAARAGGRGAPFPLRRGSGGARGARLPPSSSSPERRPSWPPRSPFPARTHRDSGAAGVRAPSPRPRLLARSTPRRAGRGRPAAAPRSPKAARARARSMLLARWWRRRCGGAPRAPCGSRRARPAQRAAARGPRRHLLRRSCRASSATTPRATGRSRRRTASSRAAETTWMVERISVPWTARFRSRARVRSASSKLSSRDQSPM